MSELRIDFPAECVDASPDIGGAPSGLVLGREYIVSGLNPQMLFGEYGVRVLGVEAPSQSGYFRSSPFRPIDEISTDESNSVPEYGATNFRPLISQGEGGSRVTVS